VRIIDGTGLASLRAEVRLDMFLSTLFTISSRGRKCMDCFRLLGMMGLVNDERYFGYMGLGCFGMFLMLGCVGHVVAGIFIRRIYSNVKID
jgi:hypothetical protein